jgi:hypothetical protein
MKVKVLAATMVAALSLMCGAAIAANSVLVVDPSAGAVAGDTKNDLQGVKVTGGDAADGYAGVGVAVASKPASAPAAAPSVVESAASDDGWKIAALCEAALLVALGAFGTALFMRSRRPEELIEPPKPEPEVLA